MRQSVGSVQSPSHDPYYTHNVTPEQRMIGAMLERAILDATGNCRMSLDRGSVTVQAHAYRWIFNWQHDHHPEVGTYGWVCESIGICPIRTQRIIRQMIADRQKLNHARPLHLIDCIQPLEY